MIRKYLVYGKQVYIATQMPEARAAENILIMEILMPIEEFWKVEEILKKVQFILASGAGQSEVQGYYRQICRICSKYAVTERDRTWLYEKASEKT